MGPTISNNIYHYSKKGSKIERHCCHTYKDTSQAPLTASRFYKQSFSVDVSFSGTSMCVCVWSWPVQKILAVERPKCLCLSSWLHSAVACVCGECAAACFCLCVFLRTYVGSFFLCVCVRACLYVCLRGRRELKGLVVSVSVDLLQTHQASQWQLPVAKSRPGCARSHQSVNCMNLDPTDTTQIHTHTHIHTDQLTSIFPCSAH